jgi:Tol biopolymer transport system component
VVDIDGSHRKKLLEGIEGEIGWFGWTPDGRELLLALQREDAGPMPLVLVSTLDGSVRVLKDFAGPRFVGAFFSPDGRYVIYQTAADRESQRDIFIMSVEDGRERAVVEDPSDDRLLGWVPGTDYVLFESDRTGSHDAWVVEVKDGRPTALPRLVKSDLWASVPVGFTEEGAFYYGVRVSTRGAHLANIDPETKRMIGEPTPVDPRLPGTNQRPQWSPDGRYLAYRKRNGGSERTVAIRSMETGETRYIEAKANIGSSRPPRWSPDGRSFLFNGWDDNGRGGLFQVDAQTGETRTLTLFQDNGESYWSDWAPDGKSVYYRVDYGEESRIEAFDIESDVTRVLRSVRPPDWIVMVWVDVSPDGQELAFWEMGEDENRLLVIPTAEGESQKPPRELVTVEKGIRQPVAADVWWSADGRHLMYQLGEGDSARLWRVPAQGGEPEPLELILGEQPEFSPDGTRIAYDYGESAYEIWVMENYLPQGG